MLLLLLMAVLLLLLLLVLQHTEDVSYCPSYPLEDWLKYHN
jgi:hypothetical protein